jgi:hypothetical protein
MTQSLWGPDGQWIGSSPPPDPAPRPQPEPDVQRAARFAGVGCLSVLGLGLLLPALFFGLFALASGASEETAEATGTVLSVEPGRDAFGMQPSCFTVEYVVDGRTHTGRTCSITATTQMVPGEDGELRSETFDEADRRFAQEHPPGSRVELSYEVDDPGQIAGGVKEVGSDWTSGNPVMTAVMTGLALVFVAASFGAFYAAVRLVRRRRAATPHPHL